MDASFIVTVQSTQYATWQGIIQWPDKDIEAHFHSELELIKMIEGMLSESLTKPAKEAGSDDIGALR